MTDGRKMRFSLAAPILTGIVLLLSFINTCQRFEPELILEITTDAIETLPGSTYKLNGTVVSFGQEEITEHGFCWSTTTNPTAEGSSTKLGARDSKGSFSSTISGLVPGTKYFIRAYAITLAGTTYGNEQTFIKDKPDITGQTGTVTDYDGNVYNWIGIGEQAWMAENLMVTHYSNGKSIPLIESRTVWDALGVEDKAYCWYNNSTTNRDTYGGLYTWAAAMNGAASSTVNPSGVQGVCPAGWHLPSDAEWKELTDYLGGSTIAGGKMKEPGITHWASPNEGATNASGFSAIPGGSRNSNGEFLDVGFLGNWWSSSEYDAHVAWYRALIYGNAGIYRGSYGMYDGFSVRCVRDD